jgi:hypothetical protein
MKVAVPSAKQVPLLGQAAEVQTVCKPCSATIPETELARSPTTNLFVLNQLGFLSGGGNAFAPSDEPYALPNHLARDPFL